MGKKITSVKGMEDLYDVQAVMTWQRVEQRAREIFERAGFQEIRTPVLEDADLFERSVGQSTEIVEKEMYTLLDRNGKKLAMRPEGTASVVRAFIEHFTSHQILEGRFYYMGPMFRYERPQKGRFRQFHQIGAEIFGSDHPLIDAELIGTASRFFSELGLKSIQLNLNSLGTLKCRENYKASLTKFLSGIAQQLCEDCQRRIQRNPLRALDCKVASCIEATQGAPSILESLNSESKGQFEVLQRALKGQNIPYVLNPRLVRGLDYYEKAVFEFTSPDLGAQNSVAAGGRYNDLVHDLGGPQVPAVGFAVGMERLAFLLAASRQVSSERLRLYLLGLDEASSLELFKGVQTLRDAGVLVELDPGSSSLKSKMRRADRWRADWVLICGPEELQRGTLLLRNMKDGSQEELPLNDWLRKLKERLSSMPSSFR